METKTVEYAFGKDTPGTWRFDAIKAKGERLAFGADSVYILRTPGKDKPTKVTATFTIE